MIGVVGALLTYFTTHNLIASVTAGVLSATFAWSYLTNVAYHKKSNHQSEKYKRIAELSAHDRFFKSPSIMQQTINLPEVPEQKFGVGFNI